MPPIYYLFIGCPENVLHVSVFMRFHRKFTYLPDKHFLAIKCWTFFCWAKVVYLVQCVFLLDIPRILYNR